MTAPDHHGYNISCFSGNDGAIDLTVAGGTAPYTYDWSNGATTQDLSNLVAGYYRVTVTDAQSLVAYEDITLTEPRALEAEVVVYEYPNGFNVSCYQCYNGNLTVATGGGVAPYSYAWNDGSTTQNRQSLGAGLLKLAITDLNGCIFETDATLTEPESNDWKMGGNTGSNPPDQFIGTSDEKDVVFKTNGTERFRLLSDGRLRSGSLSSTEGGLLRAGADGTFEIVERTCVIPYPLWRTDGNCIVDNEWLGSTNHRDLVIKTDNIERMRIKADGKVGIGTTPPNNSSYYKLYVADGIATRDVKVTSGNWPDFVFKRNYALMPLAELDRFVAAEHHLPGMPSAAEVASADGFEVGDMNRRLLKLAEEQSLYILQLNREMDGMKARLAALENKH